MMGPIESREINSLISAVFHDRAFANGPFSISIVLPQRTFLEEFNPLRGGDYSNHIPGKIKIIPPDTVIKEWEKDYQAMTQNMIYGDPLNFDKLIERIQELEKRINAIAN